MIKLGKFKDVIMCKANVEMDDETRRVLKEYALREIVKDDEVLINYAMNKALENTLKGTKKKTKK